MPSNLYRSEAIKGLRSPDELDSLLQLTRPAAWVALAVLLLVVVLTLAWGFLGRVPVQVSGIGIVLPAGTEIYQVQTPASGLVESVDVVLNQAVQEGQLIARIALPTDQTALQNARRNLTRLRAQYADQQQFADRDIAQRRRSVSQQNETLRKKIQDSQNYLDYLLDLLADQVEEQKRGYITRQQTEATRTGIYSAEQSIAEAHDAIAENELELIEFENSRQQELNALRNQVADAEDKVRELTATLGIQREVKSPTDGLISELAVKPGALVSPNDLVAIVEQRSDKLELAAFFEIGRGKRLVKGMDARVAPASVERDLYGSIVGEVVTVGSLPETQAGLVALLGNEALAAEAMSAGAPLRAIISLEPDPSTPSGLRWTSSKGPDLKITAGEQAAATVTIEEKLPVDLVIPLFDAWLR